MRGANVIDAGAGRGRNLMPKKLAAIDREPAQVGFLFYPAKLSFYDGFGILGQNYALGLMPSAFGYDSGIADLAGLCSDSIAVQGISCLVAAPGRTLLKLRSIRRPQRWSGLPCPAPFYSS